MVFGREFWSGGGASAAGDGVCRGSVSDSACFWNGIGVSGGAWRACRAHRRSERDDGRLAGHVLGRTGDGGYGRGRSVVWNGGVKGGCGTSDPATFPRL